VKVKYLLLSLAFVSLVIAACGDDNPAAPPKSTASGFNTSQMPLTLPNTTVGYGNLAVDGSGNILVPGENGTLYRIKKNTGRLEVVAANIGLSDGGPFDLMSCVYNPAVDRIYVSEVNYNPSRIYSVDPADGSSQLLVNLGNNGYICQLLMAPAGFGAHGGYLLAVTYGGAGSGIVAINPGNPTSTATVSALKCQSATFGPDGTLYATDYYGGRVVTISSTGVVTDYLTGQSNVEGIAVNKANTRMYIARTSLSGNVDSLYSVTMPGKVVKALAFEPDLDDGYYPTGLILDGAGKIIFNSGEAAKIIDFFHL
jgi:hypothetical protein